MLLYFLQGSKCCLSTCRFQVILEVTGKKYRCLSLATGKNILSNSEFIDLINIFHPQSCSLVMCSSRMVVTRHYSIKARECNFCSVNDKDNKCNLLYSSAFLRRSSVNEFSSSMIYSQHGSFSNAQAMC